tara:strand:+ start:984 stop:1172 length:189 start_codon:yes stop_codon:yes gene_type:complete
MNESEQIEEILWEAHAMNLRDEVIQTAVKLQNEHHLTKLNAYESSFEKITSDYNRTINLGDG